MTRFCIRAANRPVRAGESHYFKPGVPVEKLDKTLPNRSRGAQHGYRNSLYLQDDSPSNGLV
jgi:hypothetical protein